MGDYYDAAQAENERAKRASLEAMAQYGSRGREGLDSAQAELDTYRQKALDAALADATARGAPQGALDEIRARISGPSYLSGSVLAGQRGQLESDLARQSAANSTYFDQGAAAIPALRKRSADTAAYYAAKGSGGGAAGGGEGGVDPNKITENQLATLYGLGEMRHGQLTDEQAAAAAYADKAGKADKWNRLIGGVLGGFGGIGGAVQAAKAGVFNPPLQPPPAPKPIPSVADLARQAGVEAGFNPALVLGKTQPKTGDNPSPAQIKAANTDPYAKMAGWRADYAAKVRTFGSYQTALAGIQGDIQAAKEEGAGANFSDADLIWWLRSLKGQPHAKKLLAIEYGGKRWRAILSAAAKSAKPAKPPRKH